ncbi:uncharacterized protein LACBIDRAFT_322537 [Laccaria bicolor S238N-H82]|uniref:Predicted protein n=1 Tax=Laccaria bicolor (strain S238N-H82 / ATCC MYA-4686) TaxID=486041 RepID=B0CWN2_LACBS|nr:uncharacterized protein LACBIDRAFT_322537 [Laccaria bicolor S238N-H82]EDR13098.1 predicted protein [Laccaria bicolor S238N-H82]|eukprot:XP_001875596.1 predicted protein [Laccaria bicolor S238N-H82]
MKYSCVYTFTASHKNSVNTLAFSLDGKFLASGDEDGVLVIFNTKSGSQCGGATFLAPITSLIWALNGTIIFVGIESNGLSKAKLVGYKLAVNSNAQIQSIALHNKKLAVAAGDTVELFDLESQRSEEHGIRCWNIESHQQEWRIKPHSFRIGRSAINASGTYLVCSNLFDGFDVYCLDTQQYLRTLPAHNVENVSLSLSFVHADVEAVLGTANGAVKVVNILSGDMTADLHHDSWDMIQTVAYTVSADGISRQHIIATASSEKGPSTYVKLWMAVVDEPNDDNHPSQAQPSPDDDTIDHDPPQQTTVILPKGDSATHRYYCFCGTRRHAALIILLLLSLLAIGFPRKITSFVNPAPLWRAQQIQLLLGENWHSLCQWLQKPLMYEVTKTGQLVIITPVPLALSLRPQAQAHVSHIVKSNDRRRYSLRRRSSSVGSEKLASRSPHQSTCNESLQKTQHIAIEKPHASSSNSMLKVEPIVADRQHVPLADSELPENTTAGFKETSARTKPVVRHRGADIHGLSPSPPNISTSSLRSPAQPARTAVGSSCHRPDNINDPVLAQPTGRPGNFKATRGGNSNLPLGTRRSACDQEGTVLSQSLPQPLSAARSQLPIASPHVGPHQPKATLQPPTAAPAVSQRPTTTQLQTDSQSANLTGGVQRQTGNLEDSRNHVTYSYAYSYASRNQRRRRGAGRTYLSSRKHFVVPCTFSFSWFRSETSTWFEYKSRPSFLTG